MTNRPVRGLTSVVVAALTVGAPDRSEAQSASDAKAEALHVLSTQVDAWNRGDVSAFCAAYAEDATFLAPSGATHGRQSVLDRYRKKYPDKAAMGSLSLEAIEVRAFPAEGAGRAEAVSVVARWTLKFDKKPPASGLTLLVMRPRGASWEIAQDASM